MIIKLDILNHADFHGHFREDEDTPGLARFCAAIESVRKENPEYTFVFDSGDQTNKVLWAPKDVFKGMDLMGTDVFVLGNHEFDKGETILKENIKIASEYFPVLAANVYEKKTGQRLEGTLPYTIVEKGGIKIGVIGCTTEYTPKMVEAGAIAPFDITSAVKEIKEATPILKEMGADLIIVLSHFPFYFENGESGELFDVLKEVEDLPIDGIFGGHIPGDYAEVYHDIVVLKGGFGGCSLPHATFYYDTEKKEVVKKEARVINVLDDVLEGIPAVQKFQDEVIEPFRDFYEKPLGFAKEILPMRLAYESAMGNFIADGVLSEAKTDIMYFNATSCGRLIAEGPITRFTIHKAIAFNETIHTTVMKGKDLYDLFECVLTPERFGNNANIIFSGMRAKVDNTKKENKVISITKADGTPIDLEADYTVASSKYMSSGGNDTKSISTRFTWTDTGYHVHDAIANYVSKKETIVPNVDGRYEMIGEVENDNSPW